VDGFSLNLLYFSRGYTTHDRRFLQAFVDSQCIVNYMRLSAERLDQRALPQGINSINWIGDTRPPTKRQDYLRYRAPLQRILSEINPEVILAGPVQTSAFLVALTGYKPLVSMSWGSDLLVDADSSDTMREVTSYTLRHSAAVLGDCQAVRDKVHALTPMPDDQIVTFPWGIDLERFSPHSSALSLRRDLGWGDSPILISTRTWEPLYCLDVLVRAFGIVREWHPEARLILLGDGSQGPMIHSLISELNLDNYIHAPGRVSYELLPEYFCLSDIYVSSALSDGTSISLLEAMACGLPVIVANSHGNKEWVKQGENGWLFSGDDQAALVAALDEALSSKANFAQLKSANVSLARAKADWTKNFPQLLELFRRLAEPSSISERQVTSLHNRV